MALAILGPLEAQGAGDPDFDYLIALAYIDTAQPTRAVFALERVLAVDPGHARARAELARAHLMLGEWDKARDNARAAAAERDVPPEARRALAGLSRALAPATAGDGARVQGNLSLGLGYDSNINGATALSALEIPALAALGKATLSDAARAKAAATADLTAGIDAIEPLGDRLALIGGLGLDRHANRDAGAYDLITADGRLGLVATDGPRTLSLGLVGQEARLDDKRVRQAGGLSVQWQIPIGEGASLSPYVQTFRLTYPSEPERAAWRVAYGLAGARVIDLAGYPGAAFAGLYGGNEMARPGRSYFGHRFLGARLGLEAAFGPRWRATATAMVEDRAYGGADLLFLRPRRDRQWDLKLGFSYDLGDNWSLGPDLTWTRAQSNVPVNDYRRAAVMMVVTRVFP